MLLFGFHRINGDAGIRHCTNKFCKNFAAYVKLTYVIDKYGDPLFISAIECKYLFIKYMEEKTFCESSRV